MKVRAAGRAGNRGGRRSGWRSGRRARRWLFVVGANAAILSGLLLLLGALVEIHLRATRFRHSYFPTKFVPEVGFLLAPDSVVRWTNGSDYWTVSRTNRWGFPDREPPAPGPAPTGCRVAVIGDSFVEGKEVPREDRFPAVLERLAGAARPRWNLAVSAFARGGTGQIHQLAFYDRYARRLSPKLVILVFHLNDFADNERTLNALDQSHDPERRPFVTAERGEDGEVRLLPPHPDAAASRWAVALGVSLPAARFLSGFVSRLRGASWAADWIYGRAREGFRARLDANRSAAMDAAAANGAAGPPPVGEWRPGERRPGEGYLARMVARRIGRAFAAGGEDWIARLPPLHREAVEMTGFALDEFATRARRDGARVWLLITHRTTVAAGREAAAAIRSLAEDRGIPIMDQYEAIIRAGGDPRAATIPRDGHWSRAGHRWAAEAALARLRAAPEVCGPGPAPANGEVALREGAP